MSEFEKKTLAYAINTAFVFTMLGLIKAESWAESWGWNWNNWTIWIFFFVVIVVNFSLLAIFRLWNVPEDGGMREYFREDHLTEREKLLSYKATARTVAGFFLTILLLVIGSIFIFGVIFDRKIELTLNSMHIFEMFVLPFLAFVSIRCFVLFVYLRNERLSDCQTQLEPQESEPYQSEPRTQ